MTKYGDLNWEGLVSPLLLVPQIRNAALSMKIVSSNFRDKCVTSLPLQLMEYMAGGELLQIKTSNTRYRESF